MTKIVCSKRGGVLIPVDNEARDAVAVLKDGKDIMVEIRPARHPTQHRTFFALLNLLVENTDAFDNVEQALTAVKIAIGEADPIVDTKTGKTFWTLRSIAFESCDQARFTRIFDRTLHVITTRWLIGTATDDLRAEVEAIVADKRLASLGRRAA